MIKKTTEEDGTDEIGIDRTERVGNRQEYHGKAREQWRRSEKIRYMTTRTTSQNK